MAQIAFLSLQLGRKWIEINVMYLHPLLLLTVLEHDMGKVTFQSAVVKTCCLIHCLTQLAFFG